MKRKLYSSLQHKIIAIDLRALEAMVEPGQPPARPAVFGDSAPCVITSAIAFSMPPS